MSHYQRLSIVVVILGLSPPVHAEDSTLKSALVAGNWTHCGPSTILGAHSCTTVIINRDGANWMLSYEFARYPGVNEGGARPRTNHDGPFRITVEGQELLIWKAKDQPPTRITFLCDEKRLIMPAIVQEGPGHWVFRSERDYFEVRCVEDPSKVPIGHANVSGTELFYSFEEAPQSRFGPSAQYLRFLRRNGEKGQLAEVFRLIFDEYGFPRYERLLGTGEPSESKYELCVYVAAKQP